MSVSQQKMLRDNNKRGGFVKLGFDGKLHAASRVSVGGRYRKDFRGGGKDVDGDI